MLREVVPSLEEPSVCRARDLSTTLHSRTLQGVQGKGDGAKENGTCPLSGLGGTGVSLGTL